MSLQMAEYSILRLNNISLCVCVYIYLTYILFKSFWYILDTSAHQICVLYSLPFYSLPFLLQIWVCVWEGEEGGRECDWKFLVCGIASALPWHKIQKMQDFIQWKVSPLPRPHHFPSSGSRFPSPEATSFTSFWGNFLEVDVMDEYESTRM